MKLIFIDKESENNEIITFEDENVYPQIGEHVVLFDQNNQKALYLVNTITIDYSTKQMPFGGHDIIVYVTKIKK